MKISKTKSSEYWVYLKKKLEADFENIKLWEEAHLLFKDRIDSRYLDFVNLISQNDSFKGEGFTIMTVYCSLIEFLETTYQGKVFKSKKKNDLGAFEYGFGESKNIFTSFLITNKMFGFSKELAVEFYENVRCGLLHEAQIGVNWRIRVDNSKLINEESGVYTLNRVKFKKKIEQYLDVYKTELLSDPERKNAFIRKFDGICGL